MNRQSKNIYATRILELIDDIDKTHNREKDKDAGVKSTNAYYQDDKIRLTMEFLRLAHYILSGSTPPLSQALENILLLVENCRDYEANHSISIED